jgi:hypothetical protein
MSVKAGDAAARAASAAALGIEGNQHRRSVIALHQTRGNDADNPGMPLGRREDDAPARLGSRVAFNGSYGLVLNVALDSLSRTVVVVQSRGKLTRTVAGTRGQEFHRTRGIIEPAAGVEARRQAETDAPGGHVVDAAHALQRHEPGGRRSQELPQPVFDEDAVFLQ